MAAPVGTPSFGISQGLNYESSIVTASLNPEEILWIRSEQSGVKQVFRRGPLTMCADGPKRFVNVVAGAEYYEIVKGNKFGTKFEVTLLKDEAGPPAGTQVYPVFELMLNDSHPIPWARVPGIGPFADWAITNRLGFKLEWYENGEWRECYYQRRERSYMGTNDQGCLRGFAEANGIINCLTQVGQEGPLAWFMGFGLARVKALATTSLDQTIHLQKIEPPGLSRPVPVYKSKNQIIAELTAAGAKNVDGPFGVIPGQSARKRCDACYADNYYEGTRRLPKALNKSQWGCIRRAMPDGTLGNTCVECHMKGLVCSWTPESQFTPALLEGVNYKEYHIARAQKIDLAEKNFDLAVMKQAGCM